MSDFQNNSVLILDSLTTLLTKAVSGLDIKNHVTISTNKPEDHVRQHIVVFNEARNESKLNISLSITVHDEHEYGTKNKSMIVVFCHKEKDILYERNLECPTCFDDIVNFIVRLVLSRNTHKLSPDELLLDTSTIY